MPITIYKDRKAKLESAYSFMLNYSKKTVRFSTFFFTNSRFLSTYLFPLKMNPISARQKVMRNYKEEDLKEIDPDKKN